jgi:hypothetical protein
MDCREIKFGDRSLQEETSGQYVVGFSSGESNLGWRRFS